MEAVSHSSGYYPSLQGSWPVDRFDFTIERYTSKRRRIKIVHQERNRLPKAMLQSDWSQTDLLKTAGVQGWKANMNTGGLYTLFYWANLCKEVDETTRNKHHLETAREGFGRLETG